TELPDLGHGLAPSQLQLEPALRCSKPTACSPCLEVRLRLALPPVTATLQPHRPAPSGIPGVEGSGEGGRWSLVDGAALSQPNATGLLLLSGHAYASSRCVAVEVRASPAPALPGRPLGWVTFRCFEAPLGSELRVTVYTNSRSRRRLSQQRRVPDCSWPAAEATVPQCQVPRLEVSPGPEEVVVQVQGVMVGHSYTLRLYRNQSHGAGGPGRAVTASSPMNYSLPANEVLPCLCLQVWLEIQDPLRATLCPFSQDSEAWERLWARSQLVLHVEGQVLTCSLSAPCDLPAELVPCWQPQPAGPCQALPGLQQPVVGQGPQEFVGLRLHPNLCMQVGLSPLPVTSPGALPGRADDLLLLQRGGNTSLCVLEQGSCTPLASFTSTVRGRDPHVLVVVMVLVAQLGHTPCCHCREPGTQGCWSWSCGGTCWQGSPLRGRRALLVHAAEPVAERVACALTAALCPLGLVVVAAPGGGSGVAAWGPLPWLHAQHRRALHDGDTVILLLSPAAVAAAHQWDTGAGAVPGAGDAESISPSPHDVPTVAPCEVFAAALSCTMPALVAGNGRYVVARLEALVPAVPLALQAAPAFALPSEMGGFLRALAGPGRCQGRWPEPYVAVLAEGLERALGE
ncbi:I17RC protein, partial [Pedionomus torquatus]|nr:I17RC protein [Pedionomus torquatus]